MEARFQFLPRISLQHDHNFANPAESGLALPSTPVVDRLRCEYCNLIFTEESSRRHRRASGGGHPDKPTFCHCKAQSVEVWLKQKRLIEQVWVYTEAQQSLECEPVVEAMWREAEEIKELFEQSVNFDWSLSKVLLTRLFGGVNLDAAIEGTSLLMCNSLCTC